MATGLVVLICGVVVAGTSAGLCWAPFNDVVEWTVREDGRGTVLSAIATGTAIGATLAGILALAVTQGFLPWRAVWWIFAASAAATSITAALGVPDIDRGIAVVRPSFAGLLRRDAIPLYIIALVFGALNAVFMSFVPDRITEAGGLPGLSENGASAVVFMSYGIFGLLGLGTGRAEVRIGLDALVRAIFASAALSMLLIGAAPTGWLPVVAASGIHGAALMAVSAVISFWSLRLFPSRGTLGFTMALICMAGGSVIGPAVVGFAIEVVGAFATFLAVSVPALTIAAWPRRLPASSDGLPAKS